MRLTKTSYLYLTTSNRNEGSIYDATFRVPPASFVCKPNEVFRISLTRMSFYNDIQNVRPTNNTIAFKNLTTNSTTTITLPNGNYPFSGSGTTLPKAISQAYTDQGTSLVSISFDIATGFLTFQFTSPHQISFPNSELWRLLGFENGDTLTTNAQLQIKSTRAVKGRIYDQLYVKLREVNPIQFALDNYTSKTMSYSNALANITLNSSPYTYFSYINNTDEMSIFLADKVLTKVRLLVLDGVSSNPADHIISDIQYVLKIETFVKTEESLEDKLDRMIDLLKLSLIQNNLLQDGISPPIAEDNTINDDAE